MGVNGRRRRKRIMSIDIRQERELRGGARADHSSWKRRALRDQKKRRKKKRKQNRRPLAGKSTLVKQLSAQPQAIYLLSNFSLLRAFFSFLFSYACRSVSPSQQQKSRATQDPTGRKTMRRTQVVLVLIDDPTEHYTPTLSTCSAAEEKVVSLVLSLARCRVAKRFTQLHAT